MKNAGASAPWRAGRPIARGASEVRPLMPNIDIAHGQAVRIPALQLTSRRPFQGIVRASDGETIMLDLDDRERGELPETTDPTAMLVWEVEGIQRTCPVQIQPRSSRSLAAQVVQAERRNSPRVPVDVDIIYEMIHPDHVKESVDEVMARVNTLEERSFETNRLIRAVDDPLAALREEIGTLHTMLSALMIKVDDMHAIMAGLQPSSNSRRIKHPLSILNCSGTGMGMLVGEMHPEGEYMRIRMTLRTLPPTTIDCVGVVVRCLTVERSKDETAGPPRYDVGLRFSHIHEADRERLIQYLFKVQRRLLRDRKEAREAMTPRG
jgi:uncharacterized coiled-coil protein SlyX